MTVIQLDLPPPVSVVGALHDRSDVTCLDQDLLQLTLPGDIVIDVGWYPDRDPHGQYRLIVFRGTTDRELERPLQSRDVRLIKHSVHHLVAKYLPNASP